MFKIKHYAYYEIVNGNLECRDTLQSTDELSGLTEASLSVELNTAGELELTVPYGNQFYDIFELYVSELAVFQDDNEIWRGYVSEVTRDFDGNKTVKAEGILAYLSMSVDKFSENTTGIALNTFLNNLIDNHNSQVYPSAGTPGRMLNRSFSIVSVDVSGGPIKFENDTDYDTTWSYIENQLINEYAGFVKVRREDGVNKISYKKTSGETDTSKTQQIVFGKNLLDLDVSYNTEDFMTLMYAKCKSNDGESDVFAGPYTNNDGITKYGRIFRFETHSDVKQDDMSGVANKKLSDTGIIYRIEANALDLHNAGNEVDAILLGDHHSIFCAHCGLDGNNDFCVEKIDYNLLYWEETSFTFGRTEKIWVIDPSEDPAYIYGSQDISITKNNVDSYNHLSYVSSKANKLSDDAMSKATEALSKANECMTSAEVTAAIAAAKAEIQTPLVSNISVNGTTMTCDITVGQFVDAVAAGKAVFGNDGQDVHFVIAGYSLHSSDGTYLCFITIPENGLTFSANGLVRTDPLVLTYAP